MCSQERSSQRRGPQAAAPREFHRISPIQLRRNNTIVMAACCCSHEGPRSIEVGGGQRRERWNAAAATDVVAVHKNV